MKTIEATLKELVAVAKKCRADYRVVGSVLIVAFLKAKHRRIKDIDVFIDKTRLDCLVEELKKKGYQAQEGRKFNKLYVLSFTKPNRLPINFALLGEFKQDYCEQDVGWGFNVRINNEFIKPINYKVGATKFIGMPISSQYFTMKNSVFKPGRKEDFKALSGKIKDEAVNNPIKIYYKNCYLPGMYKLYSKYKDISGKMRHLLGFNYEQFPIVF